MSTFHSGFKGTFTANSGNEVPLMNWSVSDKAQLVDFKNSRSGGRTLHEATFLDADVSFEVDYDFDANPFAAPISCVSGTTLSGCKFFLHQSASSALDGPFWQTDVVISDANQTLNVDGKIVTKITGKGTGTLVYPV